MQELDDNALLREYAERGSEEAFSSLVARHINKVYSAALRNTGKPHQAEEITQAVFVILAKKARSLDRRVILSGWLYQTARLAAVTFIRGEIRRVHREQEAHMQTLSNEKEPDVWKQIAPLLDEAMGELNEADRYAVVLRYFDGKSMKEVGGALGASEDAAKKRVNRAVEKLEKFFLKRGIDSTAATLAEVISAHSVQAAPAALAKSVAALSLAKGVAASGSTLTLIRGVLKTMAWAKMKSAVIVTAGVLLAAGGGTVVYEALQPSRADSNHSETPPFAMGGPVDMRIKWEVGKKYSLRMEANQQAETKMPNQPQPVKSGFDATENFDISAVSKLDNGGRQLELEFGNVTMNVRSGGRSLLSLDSAQGSPRTQNPAAAIVGARLEYVTDPSGEVERFEGKDQLMKCIAGDAKSRAESIFSQLFTEDQLKALVSFGDMMPNRVVNVGEKWSRKKDIVTSIGTVTIDMKFTFKDWERHDDYNCAHIEETARLTSKSVSTQQGAAIEIEKSKIFADIWFDPVLGMVVDAVSHRTQTLKVTTQAQTVMPEQTQTTRMMLLDVK
ncbi:MAG TPA: DUF6263 family protein [Verrucomicrobiae bacterium]|jgi:RNA polymerase sigma factor (sigma-70 family)|nr:DUF6263 family protein [Verrucomicrobiae bacterium]